MKTRTIQCDINGKKAHWNCRWTLNHKSADDGKHGPGRTLDVLVGKATESRRNLSAVRGAHEEGLWTYVFDEANGNEEKSTFVLPAELSPAEQYLRNSLQTASSDGCDAIAIKFLLPDTDGYIIKSDFLEQRLESKGLTVAGFTAPLQFVHGISGSTGQTEAESSFSRLLSIAIGAVLLDDHRPGAMAELEAEVQNRLAFPWLSASPLHRRRLALVLEPASVVPARRRWNAAASLGIDLILVSSKPYLSGEKALFEQTFESYVEVDLRPDSGLGQRLADALRSSANNLDGIFATKDHLLTGVAEAAQRLGLFTSPPEAYAIASDKFAAQIKEPNVENTFLVKSMGELDSIVASLPPDAFPLVVKPCRGDASQCVAKVSNETGLKEAVQSALAYGVPHRALIEPYVQGPEVDVNFALLDGNVLFGEVCDNFPSQGDTVTSTSSDELLHFSETINLSPSKLPQSEQEMLVKHFHQTLLRHGFRSGVFHVEGRVRNSTMRYQIVDDESGTLDLEVRPDAYAARPTAFLHEINARPPGFQCCAALLLCFGVDFWALQMLSAAQDRERLTALSTPFLSRAGDHLSVENLHCPVTQAAVQTAFPSLDLSIKRPHFMGDPMPELREQNAESGSRVVQCQVCINGGEFYGGSGWVWLVTFVVASRTGRREALAMSGRMVDKYRQAVQAISGLSAKSVAEQC